MGGGEGGVSARVALGACKTVFEHFKEHKVPRKPTDGSLA
jgi:hypothetical protein